MYLWWFGVLELVAYFLFFLNEKTSEEIIKQMDAPSVAKLGNSDCWIVNHKCK